MVVCRFYQQGRCAKGDTCSFEHPKSVTTDAPWRNTTATTTSRPSKSLSQNAAEPSICPFFRRGTCKFGDRCKKSHHLSGVASPERTAAADTRSNVVCAFFLRNACSKGASCPFRHDVEPLAASSHQNRGFGLQPYQQTAPTSFSIEQKNHDPTPKVIAGAKVTFDDGVAISKIALPADFSTLAITHIPAAASQGDVSKVLGTWVSKEQIDVVSWKVDAETSLPSAEVRVADGGRLCRADTSTKPILKLFGSDLQVHPIHLGSTEAGTNRLQLSTVSCTWHNPSRTASLKYGNSDRADRTIAALRDTKNELHGRIPTFERARHSTSPFHRFSNARAHVSVHVVRVGNLDARTSVEELRQYLNQHAPANIEVHPSSHELSSIALQARVKKKLENLGNLLEWVVSTQPPGAKVKALARFTYHNEAAQAAKELEGWRIDPRSNDVLHVQHVISVKLPVSQRVLAVIQPQLDALAHSSQSTDFVRVKAYDNRSKVYTQIRVSGTEKTSVARVKLEVESLLAGNIVRDGSQPLTNPFFFQATAVSMLDEFMTKHGVVIVCDRSRNVLRTYGNAQGIEAAQEALRTMTTELNDQTKELVLDSYTLAAAVMGGFQATIAALGKSKVKLDITSDPKRILVSGSDADVEVVRGILQSHDVDSSNAMTSLKVNNDEHMLCAVCWTPAEDPITTTCGHRYCRDCITSQAISTSTFPIQCLGNSGKCNTPFSLSELQHILTTDAFDNLLESSLTQHIRSHPKDYSYCSTPDCDRFYRVSTPEAAIDFNCEHCLTSICTACHTAAHDGETCKQAKASRDGVDQFAEWKKENDVRDCPSCATPIQKNEGCNHMECKACQAHICWFCMKVFERGPEVYKHMNDKHTDDWRL